VSRLALSADGHLRSGHAAALTLLLMLLTPAPAWAHKLNVFAAADGTLIEGSAYFAGGGKASGTRILVTDAAGEVLAKLSTAPDGTFSYRAIAPVDHRVVAETLDGHRAEWRVAAAELAGAFASANEAERPTAKAPSRDSTGGEGMNNAEPEPSPAAGGALDPALEAAIEGAVARQVRPLREEILAAHSAVRLRDILGGIGYLFGLAGLGLWWHARRRDRGR